MALKILFFTKDGFTIAADVDIESIPEEQRNIELEKYRYYFSQKDYNELSSAYDNISLVAEADKKFIETIDPDNSKFLMTYIKPFNFRKQPDKYENNMNPPEIPSFADKENTLHFDYNISDESIPEFVKQLGFKIIHKDTVFNINNLDDDILNEKAAEVDTPKRTITFYCNHYTFKPADYRKLKNRIQKYLLEKARNPALDIIDYTQTISDLYEKKLFNVYAQEHKFASLMESYIAHEIHHIKNRMIISGMYYKKDAKRFTSEDTYKICVENERSAYLTGTIDAINAYLKSGNLNDFSMFDNKSQWVEHKLQELPESQRVAFVTDMHQIVNGSLKFFDLHDRKSYDEHQFKSNAIDIAEKAPMDVPEDSDHQQYNHLRKAFYSISRYNPETGRMETIDLSQYIAAENEIVVTNDNIENIVKPCQEKIQERLSQYNRAAGAANIDVSLLAKARRMQRDGIKKPVIVSDVQTFNISSLFDENDHYNAPDDRSDWSNPLKNYWKNIHGYTEICKNNSEYKFKINNDTVKYTSQSDVSLSKNAKYSTYVKLLEEPANKNNAVNFLESLNEEQKLLLYVACIVSGRKTKGHIPQNLERIASMTSIPQDQRERFAQIMQERNANHSQRATKLSYRSGISRGCSR